MLLVLTTILFQFLDRTIYKAWRSLFPSICTESCFLFAFTHLRLPPFCQQGYMRKQGLVGSEKLQHHRVAAELIEHVAMKLQDERESGTMQSHNQLLKSAKIPSHQLQHFTSTKDEL